jgi:NAD(P)-dependent dehydrogenase (short-subunit alcohol dehydrogenase family)
MTRGIFIAGNESMLSRAIENEAVSRVEKYAAALIPNRLSGVLSKNLPPANDKRLSLDWNPSSPISARTLALAAENRLEQIDEAILICSPPSIRGSVAELPLSDVEVMINDHIKGWFFLVKELAAVFKNRKRGTLALVYPGIKMNNGKEDAADILGPSSLASFSALVKSLLSAAHNEPYITLGFSCSGAGNEAVFAKFLFKKIDTANNRSSGKFYKYSMLSRVLGKFKVR